jgi:hypothetical protein
MPRLPVSAAAEANLRTAVRLRVPRPEPGLIGVRAMHHASHPAPGVSASQQARLTPTRQQPLPTRNLVSPVPAHQPRQPYATTTNASSPSQLPPAPDGPEPIIHPVFETQTSTYQYLVADPATKTAVIIDPVLDYDPTKRQVSTQAADELLSLAREKGYTISHILETHAHADHLTASFYLQRKLEERQGTKPPVGIGRRIGQVQTMFGKRYGIDSEEYDGVFDILWEDDAEFRVGELRGRVLHLPGHTPDHVGYWIGGECFGFPAIGVLEGNWHLVTKLSAIQSHLFGSPLLTQSRQRLLWRLAIPPKHRHRAV